MTYYNKICIKCGAFYIMQNNKVNQIIFYQIQQPGLIIKFKIFKISYKKFMSIDFTSLNIQFSQADKASVFFAHLQNVFKELLTLNIQKQYEKQQQLISKIDKILFDIFFQNKKLQKQYFDVSKNLKNMLSECSELINECKSDREQLVKVTEDRQKILEKLKQSTNQSLQIVTENEKLFQQLQKMRQINSLLIQKNQVLEEQIQNVTTTSQGYDKIVNISKDFEKIRQNNTSLQNDIADILKTTQMYGNASQPLQIMCLAFQEKPSLREQLWNEIRQKHKNKFEDMQRTRQNFYEFNYIDALMLFTNKSNNL